MNIERINTAASKTTIFGWFAGLAYFNWFAGDASHVPWWGHLLLVVVGMFAASIIIGGGISLLMAAITKMITGRADGSPHGFAWGAFVSPVLAFFAAKYVLALFAGLA